MLFYLIFILFFLLFVGLFGIYVLPRIKYFYYVYLLRNLYITIFLLSFMFSFLVWFVENWEFVRFGFETLCMDRIEIERVPTVGEMISDLRATQKNTMNPASFEHKIQLLNVSSVERDIRADYLELKREMFADTLKKFGGDFSFVSQHHASSSKGKMSSYAEYSTQPTEPVSKEGFSVVSDTKMSEPVSEECVPYRDDTYDNYRVPLKEDPDYIRYMEEYNKLSPQEQRDRDVVAGVAGYCTIVIFIAVVFLL